MGKRRDSNKKCYTGGECNATTSKGYGGGVSKNSKFSVFEFADADLRVETESRKTLAKFGTKSPSKKPAHYCQQLDKYGFLECFAHRTKTQRRHSGNGISDFDVTNKVFHQGFECSSCGAVSYAPGKRNPGGCTTAWNHNKVFYIDSDEDESAELRPTTNFNLAENEGSLEEQSPDYAKHSKNTDCEAVVVVDPKYVKYGNNYYTNCLLTFSQGWIRLEGSPLGDGKISHCLQCSTFDILKIEHQKCESVRADVVNLHLKSKDTNFAETDDRNSGCVELEFVVHDDPQWSKKKEDIKSMDLKYKAAWKTLESACCFDKSFEDILYPDGDPDAVFLSKRDIELLQPRTFINDTLIDFYIKYLLTKTKPEEQHRFHFFNTFFFRKLADIDQNLDRTWEGRAAFQRVRKWTRNVNLFEKDYLFMPINFSLHWSLIIICHPGEVAKFREKGTDGSSKVPCILHLDSIKGNHSGFENLIRSYLWEEWTERRSGHDEHIATKFLNITFVAPQLPQQENFFDCGLFLLHYAELFLEQALNFSTPNDFDFLNKDWFHPDEVSLKKRDHIRNLIYKVVEDNALKDPLVVCDDKNLRSGINQEGDSAHSVQENGLRESPLCIRFHSCDDYNEVRGQQRKINCMRDDSCQLHRQEELGKQATFPPQGTSSRCESDEADKPMPPYFPLSSFRSGEVKVSCGTSKTCSSMSPVTISVQNEDCVLEVASAEREKERYEISSTSSEDLTACVVEDSEEESAVESSRRTRRSSFLISPTSLVM